MNCGNMLANDYNKIDQQERDILEHIIRYNITVTDAVQRLFFDDNEKRAVNTLTSLKKRKYIRSYDLYPGKKYWLLGSAAANLFNITKIITKPLRMEPLARTYGILVFCCLGDDFRTLMTIDEFKVRFPEYFVPGLPSSSYYIDNDGKKGRLGIIHVDQGSDYMRIIRRCRKITQIRMKLESFNNLILQKDGFLIAIVTAHQEKKYRLEKAIRKEKDSFSVKYRIEVCPDLANLI